MHEPEFNIVTPHMARIFRVSLPVLVNLDLPCFARCSSNWRNISDRTVTSADLISFY